MAKTKGAKSGKSYPTMAKNAKVEGVDYPHRNRDLSDEEKEEQADNGMDRKTAQRVLGGRKKKYY